MKIRELAEYPEFPEFAEFFDFCENRRIRGYPRYDWGLVIRGSILRNFDHSAYNLRPMEIQNSARNLRTAGNFRAPFADLPKTPSTAGNWPFLPNF